MSSVIVLVSFGTGVCWGGEGRGIGFHTAAVFFAPGSWVALACGVTMGSTGSLVVTGGAMAAAGTKVFGGSNPVNHRSVQYWNQGIILLTWLGIAIRGLYGSPGAGL